MAKADSRRVTGADVARASGFSRQLVGFVLNNTPGQSIPEVTREKVLRAADQLGYVPHGPAQALRRGRGRTVLLALPDIPQGPTMGDVVASIADELAANGLTLVTYFPGSDRRSPRDVAAALAPIVVVGIARFTEAEVAIFEASGAAVVIPRPGTQEADSLEAAGRVLTAIQVDYLADRGHRHIAFAQPLDERAAYLADSRYDGAREAAKRRGLPAVTRGMVDQSGAQSALREWRDREHPVTGVACFNDDVAFAVLAAARSAGLRIPDELAVIGAEDIPVARFAEPPMTTIAVDGTHVGVHLARTIIELLADRAPALPSFLEAIRLVVRSSA